MKKIIGFIIFIALVSLSACTKDTDEAKNDSFAQNGVKDWFNNTFKNSKEWQQNADSQNKVPDWSKGTYQKNDGVEVFEFPLVENYAKNKTATQKESNSTLLKIAFLKISSDSIIVRKLYYIPESNFLNSKLYDKSNIDIGKYNNNFKGLLITKKWNNQVLSYKNIDNKTIVELAIPKDFENIGNSNKSATAKVSSGEEPYAYYIQLGSCLIKGNQSKIDYWYYNPITGKTDLYKGSYYNNNTYQQNGYYYPLMSTSPAAAAITTAQSIEDKIISSKLAPCPQKVLDKLKKSTDLDIATLFTAFGASTKFNITMISEEIKADKNGNVAIATTERTTGLPAYNYTIKITTDYTDGTELFKATAIVHEMIHAYFISLVDNPSRDREFGLFQDYPLLFQTWVNRKYPGSTDLKQHEEMAKTYVNSIGLLLQEFQTGMPVNTGIPDQRYTDLAWHGLEKTTIYQKIFPLGSAERIRIQNVFGAEASGRTVGNIAPIGKKCN